VQSFIFTSLIAHIISKLEKITFFVQTFSLDAVYKLFSSFKIDGAMNFLSRQVARKGQVFFPPQKIPVFLIMLSFPQQDFCQSYTEDPVEYVGDDSQYEWKRKHLKTDDASGIYKINQHI